MSAPASSETESESGSSHRTTSTVGIASSNTTPNKSTRQAMSNPAVVIKNSPGNKLSSGTAATSSKMAKSSSSQSGGLLPATGGGHQTKRQFFLDIVKQSNMSCQSGDYATAIALYTEALKIDPNNHILYSNRSAAFIKLGQFSRALQDALKARDLSPTWAKGYYRQGIAHNCLSQHPESLAAFSAGLAIDPKSTQLLYGLREAALKSPLKSKLEPTFTQLDTMKLMKSPFVVISVVGQELLAAGYHTAAVAVLESALKIGTTNVKLKGSVISALSSAYWALNSLDKAITYMQQDLAVAKQLGDVSGECRAHGNLGAAYFSKANYKEALTSHRYQLVLAMKCKDTHAAAAALTSLGHVYSAIGDYSNALASHKQCVQLVKQMGDLLQEAREIGNVGAVYLVMGDFDNATDCHSEHLRIAKVLKNKTEEARAYSNLGSSYHYRRNYEQAITFHNHVLQIAQEVQDHHIEARAYAGLGHAARCMGDYALAKSWHEKQLDMALATKDKMAEGRACSNLGIVFQLLSEHDSALKLHQAHLNIATSLHDRGGMGRAYGNIGNAYNAMGYFEQAIKYHKQELAISKEVNDRSSEASTHGNLAVAYQAMGMCDKALVHYHSHLNISRELKDTSGEACALLNLGNCHSSQGDFAQAVPFYENYLMLSQELSDFEGEAKACHFLGYAHYSLGNFKEAVRYYDQDLLLAKDCQNKTNIARAYCNLGLTHFALGNFEKALECQKMFLSVAHAMKDVPTKFRALSNIGNVLLKTKRTDEALQVYNKQIMLAKASEDRPAEAAALAAIGMTYRLLKKYDRALGYHTQELTVYEENSDIKGECRAHGNLGAVHISLGNYTSAIRCYQEMLERAKQLKDSGSEAHAYGNLGIARMNLGNYHDAINHFKQQLSILDSIDLNKLKGSKMPIPSRPEALLMQQGPNQHLILMYMEKGRALSSLGDCYNALGDYDNAIKAYETALQMSSKTKNPKELDRLLQSIGHCYSNAGKYSTAAMYFERRLHLLVSLENMQNDCVEDSPEPVVPDMDLPILMLSTYENLGMAYFEARNFDQATSYFLKSLDLARLQSDRTLEALAVSNLGKVYHVQGDCDQALGYHEADLKISQETGSIQGRARAYCNIGSVYETLGNYEQALRCQEQHLNLISQMESKAMGTNGTLPRNSQGQSDITKVAAYGNIGRIHNALGNNIQAIAYLQQALQFADKMAAPVKTTPKFREEESKIRYLVGLALWRNGDLEAALVHLEKSADIIDRIRNQVGNVGEYALSLFDRQIAAYQALQQILVPIGRTDMTLLMAERTRTLANATLQVGKNRSSIADSVDMIDSVEALIQRVDRIGSAVLYFSTAGTYLHSWLLIPGRGIVKFHETCVNTDEEDGVENNPELASMGSLIEKYILGTREALGIDSGVSSFGSTKNLDNCMDDGGDTTDLWSQHLEELGDKLNQDNDKTGFLRMVSRNHRFNCSSYSLSSLFSVGSATGSVKSTSVSRPGSTRSSKNQRGGIMWQGPICLRSLYQMLIAPFEEELNVLDKTCYKELILVVDNNLLLVPFPILRGSPNDEYLCEKFKLLITTSISSIKSKPDSGDMGNVGLPLVVGNPLLHSDIMDHWGWTEIPRSENEAVMVGEILQCQSLTRSQATKENILKEITSATCIHLATHVSWKLAAVVLASDNGDHSYVDEDRLNGPHMSEYLLTAGDLLQLKLSAKLVVLSSCHTRDNPGVVNADNLITLAKAILVAGATSVLVTLWPVPETASKTFYRAFYSSLLQGSRISYAMTEAMLTVQHTKHFAHPANWSGYLLLGSDIQLSPKVPLATHALWELMKNPDRSRDALRVTLHLVEKSLQRINNGHNNAMFTTQKSIENKVGSVSGWKEILMAVGFRFEPSSNGLPSAVFFPQSDPGQRLIKTSSNLQSILGLPHPCIHALSKLLATPEAGEDVISTLRHTIAEVTKQVEDEDHQVEAHVNVKLWGIAGYNELLASLGFDLVEVGENEVILALGNHVNSRILELALQAALALFDPTLGPRQHLPAQFRNLSLESLDSNDDEISRVISTMNSGAYLPLRQQIALGRGAFTSYVRSRGEPDGHTNVTSQPVSRTDANEPKCLQILSPDTAAQKPKDPAAVFSTKSKISQLDLNLGLDSITDMDLEALSAIKRKAPDAMFSKAPSGRFGNTSASSTAVPVKYNLPANARAQQPSNLPWSGSAGSALKNTVVGKYSTTIEDRKANQVVSSELSELYQEHNSKGIGLAPPLATLLMVNQMSLSQIEASRAGDDGCKSDNEGLSMDESLSAFDQLSVAEDSCAESSGREYPPIARKRVNLFPAKNHIKLTQANLSLNISSVSSTLEGSSSSSSKGSPSELSRRDEGDGRSLTDSQYGSYSPSMAQSDLLAPHKGKLDRSRLPVFNHSSSTLEGRKLNLLSTKPATSTPVKSILSKGKSIAALPMLSEQELRTTDTNKSKYPESGSRSLRLSPVRSGNKKLPISMTDFGQKSSEC